MKPLFKCELSFFPSSHLSHIYDGFEKLRKAGIVDISVKPFTGKRDKPLLHVKIDNKYTVIYDTLDGFNWIKGSIEDNLNYFRNNIKADFYFKRSFNEKVLEYSPDNCKVYPLGLNYPFKMEGNYPRDLKEVIKDFFRDNYIISRYLKLNKISLYSKDFEYYPVPSHENKILCLMRLWDPDDVTLEHLKVERESINRNRISCIKACQKEFGKYFTGGLQADRFSIQHSKELLMPFSLTKRQTFLKTIKENNICIATTGLHNSIGWKFGEYVAASRAIISESLNYEIPGNFAINKNYLDFRNEDDLLKNIHYLLKNKSALTEMMISNYHYYNNYLKPDALVLKSLLKIKLHN